MHENYVSKYRFADLENWCFFDGIDTLKSEGYYCSEEKRLTLDSVDYSTFQQIRSIRIFSQVENMERLLTLIRQMPNLLILEWPNELIKYLKTDSIPENIKVLDIRGEGSVKFDDAFHSSSIQVLRGGYGKVKFKERNFNNLQHLSLRLDGKKTMLKTIGKLSTLTSLETGPFSSNVLFSEIADLKINYLRLDGGTLDSLNGIENLQYLTNIWIASFPRLTDLTPLQKLPSLKELTIGYCKNIDISSLIDIHWLEKLFIYGCGLDDSDENALKLKNNLLKCSIN